MMRITFELNPDKIAEIDQLVIDGRFEDRKHLFNSALTMVQWAMRHGKAGHQIAAIDEAAKTYHELAMPFLTGISEQ